MMKYFALSYRPKPRLSARIVVRATLSLMFISSLQTSPAIADPLEDALTGPSAAGERLIMERAGVVPPREFDAAPLEALRVPEVEGLPVLGADVQVNTSATGTTESSTQSETAMAVRGNTICAGYNNSGTGGFSGLARSTDLGATWTDLGGIGQSGDPVIAVNQGTGTFYYAEIATIGGNPAIGVARSTDDCQTFGAPVDASPGASAIATTTLNDKPWIAVDNTGGAGNGNIYVCWTRFDSVAASELRFSRSTDGGATYVNEQILAPGGTAPFGCSVAVGSNGEVNVAWADRSGVTQDDIRFRRSVDAGQNFAAAISVSTGNRHPGIDTIATCPTGLNPAATRPTLTGNIRMLHQAWMAADTTAGPFDGNLYVVWATDPVGTPDNSDVFFSRSTDGGATWSAPVQLGAGGGATDQFEPFVAVGGTGQISVAWYDRRNDATNNTLIDVYKAFSTDGGATFGLIARVTAASFPVPPINPNFDPGVVNCYMGEYIAVAGDATNFYYLWGDNRNTVVTAAFPGGRPDPDVFFEAEAIPGINQPPVALCQDVTVNTDPGVCTATSASVDNGSFDPDGDPITLEQIPPGPYGLGITNVTLVVTDDSGASDSCTAVVTVVDTTPPSIASTTAIPNVLWPPNHKMVPVKVAVSVSDICDATPTCNITSVSSNEPVNGRGDGNTAPDWEITGSLTVKLRTKRAGPSSGRLYTIAVACTDDSGNSSTATVGVTVPHNKGK